MSKTEATPKKMLATRDFTDAGDGKTFTAGSVVETSDGALANYAAAGLVSPEESQAAKAAA